MTLSYEMTEEFFVSVRRKTALNPVFMVVIFNVVYLSFCIIDAPAYYEFLDISAYEKLTRILANHWYISVTFSLVATAIFYYLILPLIFKRQYRSCPILHGTQTCELLDEGLKFTGNSGESTVQWDKIYKWKATPDYVLVFIMMNMYFAIPRRQDGKELDVAPIEEALQQHLPK